MRKINFKTGFAQGILGIVLFLFTFLQFNIWPAHQNPSVWMVVLRLSPLYIALACMLWGAFAEMHLRYKKQIAIQREADNFAVKVWADFGMMYPDAREYLNNDKRMYIRIYKR